MERLWHKGVVKNGPDLNSADREALLAVIAEQQTTIEQKNWSVVRRLVGYALHVRPSLRQLARVYSLMDQYANFFQPVIVELRKRVDELERRVTHGPSGGMPGNKPGKRGESEGRKPRKRRANGFARRRMEPTQRVIHAVESCPECGTGLAGGWAHRTREVIEQVFVARICALCGQRWLPRDQLKGLVVGRQRFGVNLVSLVVTLREEGRLPIRGIQQYLQTVHQLKLSVGAIVDMIHQVARQAQPVVAEMVERI